jgi:hypothetical protein
MPSVEFMQQLFGTTANVTLIDGKLICHVKVLRAIIQAARLLHNQLYLSELTKKKYSSITVQLNLKKSNYKMIGLEAINGAALDEILNNLPVGVTTVGLTKLIPSARERAYRILNSLKNNGFDFVTVCGDGFSAADKATFEALNIQPTAPLNAAVIRTIAAPIQPKAKKKRKPPEPDKSTEKYNKQKLEEEQTIARLNKEIKELKELKEEFDKKLTQKEIKRAHEKLSEDTSSSSSSAAPNPSLAKRAWSPTLLFCDKDVEEILDKLDSPPTLPQSEPFLANTSPDTTQHYPSFFNAARTPSAPYSLENDLSTTDSLQAPYSNLGSVASFSQPTSPVYATFFASANKRGDSPEATDLLSTAHPLGHRIFN